MDEGQRERARRVACNSPSGSLGKAAICPNFERWYVRALGNACSGRVGELYERNRATLAQPATDRNIEAWAELETRFFQREGGCTAVLGGMLSREGRIRMMKEARDRP